MTHIYKLTVKFNIKIVFFLSMIFFLYAKYNYAENQYTISNFSVHETKSLTTSKGYKFSISQSIGNWQDNLGNYGKSKIIFYVEEFNENTILKGLGELIDQNKKKLWFVAERESTLEAGVGNINIIDADNKYASIIKMKCVYAIKYLDDRSFLKVKCK